MDLLAFVLGIICGVGASLFVLLLYCAIRSSGEASRREEKWDQET